MSDLFKVHGRPGSDGSVEYYDVTTGSPVFNIAQFGNRQYAKVTITAAQMLALNTTPVTLVAAPGAGKTIFVDSMVLFLNFNANAYASGGTVSFKTGSIVIATTTNTLINGGAAVAIQPAFPNLGTSASLGAANAALTASCTVAFTTGDSPIDVHIWYSLLST